jgi:hypothetical protein
MLGRVEPRSLCHSNRSHCHTAPVRSESCEIESGRPLPLQATQLVWSDPERFGNLGEDRDRRIAHTTFDTTEPP